MLLKGQVTSDYLLYGRLYIPTGRLDALYSTRISATLQGLVAAISDPRADYTHSRGLRTGASPQQHNVQSSARHWTLVYGVYV